jgi:hypothetical protein
MWLYIGTTTHKENNKRNNKISVPGGKVEGDIRSLNGRRIREGYWQGYIDGRSI